MEDIVEKYREVKKKLDQVGPGFCLAKWNQVTMHLGTGLNHSCHHPTPHKISKKEVALGGATYLHNTSFKKKQWRMMLSGKRPPECEYCWKIEDTGTSNFSDRVFKSVEPWALPTLEHIKNSDWSENYYPRYLEVSFSNRCNFKCLYCDPKFSSRWNQEVKQFGPVRVSDSYSMNHPISAEDEKNCNDIENNELVKAFWEWWPDLIKNLHSLRVTGGEPLLVPETYKMIEYIIDNPEQCKNLTFFGINTNLGMSDDQFERFLDLSEKLSEEVPEYVIFTSIESGKEAAEYTRFGLNYDTFWDRMDRIASRLPKMTVCLMATYNVLSLGTYLDVIKRCVSLKYKYLAEFLSSNLLRTENVNIKGLREGSETLTIEQSPETPITGEEIGVLDRRIYGTPVMLDTSYLRYPSFLDIHSAPVSVRSNIVECIEYIQRFKKKNILWRRYDEHGKMYEDTFNIGPGFCEMELEKIQRLLDYFDTPLHNFNYDYEREMLKNFLEEEDRRRGTDFRKIFPELQL